MGLSSSIFYLALQSIKSDDIKLFKKVIKSDRFFYNFLKTYPDDTPILKIKNHEFIDDFTLLHHTCLYDSKKIAKYLIKKLNCNLNKYCSGYTPLHIAIAHGSVEVVKILLNNGAKNLKMLNDYPIIKSKGIKSFDLPNHLLTKEVSKNNNTYAGKMWQIIDLIKEVNCITLSFNNIIIPYAILVS